MSRDGIACYRGENADGTQAPGDCSLEQWRYRIGSFGARHVKSKLCLRSFGNILKDILNFLRLCLFNICDSIPIRIAFSLVILFVISLLLPIILLSMTLLLQTARVFDTIYNYVSVLSNALSNIIRILATPFNQKRWKFILCKIIVCVVVIFSIVYMLLVLAGLEVNPGPK